MSYSCGYFRSEDDSLRQAQVNKTEHILEKLYLKEGMTLLDIGCGWGFSAEDGRGKIRREGHRNHSGVRNSTVSSAGRSRKRDCRTVSR